MSMTINTILADTMSITHGLVDMGRVSTLLSVVEPAYWEVGSTQDMSVVSKNGVVGAIDVIVEGLERN